jgi:plasmid stabilization system protein ParE
MKAVVRSAAREDILRQYEYYLVSKGVLCVVRVLHGKRDLDALL